MAKWGNKNKEMPTMKGVDERDLMMGVMVSLKSGNYGNDLLQNCDLPPPTKILSGSGVDKRVINCFIDKEKARAQRMKDDGVTIDERDGKIGLLKALRLSQTRAREAQAKCQAIAKETDLVALALMQDSMQVFGYRQLVRLLEFQVSSLQKKQGSCDRALRKGEEQAEEEEDGSGNGGLTWIMAVAFVLGIASFGFALGWKYY